MSIAPALVPQELRPRRTQLWLPADRTTWGFGSRAARAGAPQAGRPENPWLRWPSALWRIPATIVSWLAFLPHPETLAAQGKAHLKVAPLTERTEPAPWWQRRAVAGLVFGVDLVGGAAGVVAVLSMTRNPVILAALGITVLGVVAGIVETLNAGWRAAGWRSFGRWVIPGRWVTPPATSRGARVTAGRSCTAGSPTSTRPGIAYVCFITDAYLPGGRGLAGRFAHADHDGARRHRDGPVVPRHPTRRPAMSLRCRGRKFTSIRYGERPYGGSTQAWTTAGSP